MSSPSSPTLDLDVRQRRIERRIASVAIAAALVSPWLLLSANGWANGWADGWMSALLSLAGGLLVAAGFWHGGWIGSRYRLVRITWLPDGRWNLSTHAGKGIEARLSAATRRGPNFAWLRWQAPYPGSMLLVDKDLRPGEFRRLLVRLSIDRLQEPIAMSFADAGRTFIKCDSPPVATLKTVFRRSLLPGARGVRAAPASPPAGLPVARTRRQ